MKLRQLWQIVRASLWFVPGASVVVAVGVAFVLIDAGTTLKPELFERWPRLFGAGAAGARGLLATVASSMITVVGVVFSITIVALSLASSQYTSRVLRNFMRDRGNQAVLGVFVGIFAYCLVVLRTIRGGDEGAFVPSLAVLFALFLAFLGIAVLIYFIHHISTTIQAAHILAAVARDTLLAIDRLFPEGVGDEDEAEADLNDCGQMWHAVPALTTGYLQSLDTEGMLAFAGERQTVVRMERGIGQFVIEGTPLVSILGMRPAEDDQHRLDSLWSVGRQRTVEQDAGFGVRQIVDVALRALSPGVNDTTTAVMCIDYLSAILVRLTARRIESHYRSDDGELRLVTRGPTYASLVGESFDQIRRNAGGNLAILEALLGSMELLANQTNSPARSRVLLAHTQAVAELNQRTTPAPRDREQINHRANRIIELLAPAEAFHNRASGD